MQAIKFIILILFAILVAAFTVKNGNPVNFTYYDFKLQTHSIELPLVLLILIPFGLGLLLAFVLGLVGRIKLKTRLARQNRTIKSLEAELEKLRPEPTLSASENE